MNLFFTSYGIYDETTRMINALNNLSFPNKWRDPNTNQEMQGFIQGILQPVQLWKFSFPEDSLPLVLRTIKFNNLASHHQNLSKYYMLLRKALKLNKIPNIDMNGSFVPLIREKFPNVNLIAIGISNDLKSHNGNENI